MNLSIDSNAVYSQLLQAPMVRLIRAKEAELVMQFVDKARKIQPLGKVIVSDDGVIANIQLEQGDQIVIPQKRI